jgi:hypothetical protein
LIGATVNQPSQYAHDERPPTWSATRLPSGWNDSNAYEGRPPARSGHVAAISARQKQRKTPIVTMIPNSTIEKPPRATSA